MKIPVNDAFDQWCYTATDSRFYCDSSPLSVLTVVLHKVCGNDPKRFEEALIALRSAFDAGASAARKLEA